MLARRFTHHQAHQIVWSMLWRVRTRPCTFEAPPLVCMHVLQAGPGQRCLPIPNALPPFRARALFTHAACNQARCSLARSVNPMIGMQHWTTFITAQHWRQIPVPVVDRETLFITNTRARARTRAPHSLPPLCCCRGYPGASIRRSRQPQPQLQPQRILGGMRAAGAAAGQQRAARARPRGLAPPRSTGR